GIVGDDRDIIFGDRDIEFEDVHTVFERIPKSGKSILGAAPAGAPMTMNENPLSIRAGQHEGRHGAGTKSPSRKHRNPSLPHWNDSSMDGPGLSVHVIHQEVLPEGVRSREVRLATANLRHFLDKTDQVVVAGQHEGVDEDSLLAAPADFFQS